MRKVLLFMGALCFMASPVWASPCTPASLSSYVSSAASCTVNTNAYSGFAASIANGQASTISVAPVTTGSNAGDLSLTSVSLSALAGSASTFSFTVTAPAGSLITDFALQLSGGSGDTVFLGLSNGASLMAANTGMAMTTFTGVSSLTVTGTLAVLAGSTGTATVWMGPSLTSNQAVAEPGTVTLFAIALLGFIGLVRTRQAAFVR